MAKGNKPVPPAANQTQPGGGKHVPSAVIGAAVQDNSHAIRRHIDQSQDDVDQTPQTVGVNPDPPAQRQASVPNAPAGPQTAGFSRFGSYY